MVSMIKLSEHLAQFHIIINMSISFYFIIFDMKIRDIEWILKIHKWTRHLRKFRNPVP